ncbi:conserved hypothetical protein [Xenorhabdus bovienii str. kraussei Becker Underwood]|uniref:Uncharacterized protein n=1 Tax=Xenorhabdus bovienii str. kraussei Becker Underwood TaxID=1398204 RepID=A0A077PM95_XENBV|nr:conserved hypothetical protein [Xenorhabdus bovienii str. kraussei Becker Underwood]
MHNAYSAATRDQKESKEITAVNKRTAEILEKHLEDHNETNKWKQKFQQAEVNND